MTALQDQIDNDLRDYNTLGNPGSGVYTFLMSDLRDILNTMAVGSQFITEVGTFLNAADVNAARTALGLGTGSSPTFTGLTLTGSMTADTNTFRIDATNNRVGVGTATPATTFDVVGAAAFSSTVSVAGTMTLTGNLVVDTSLLYVDSSGNRVGINTASPAFAFDVVGEMRSIANNATNALRVVQTGPGNVVLFEDQASTDVTPWLMNGDGVVVHGHTVAQVAESSLTPISQVQSLDSNANGYWVQRWSANANPAYLRLGKSRGTAIGTRGTLSLNDQIGSILFLGDDGTVFRAAAEIVAEADEVWGSNDTPARIVFKTAPNSSGTAVENMCLSSTGFLSLDGDRDTGFFVPASNELAFHAGGSEAMRLEENGRLIINHTDSVSSASTHYELQIHGNGAATSGAMFVNWAAVSGSDARLVLAKSMSGTVGTRGAVAVNDNLGVVAFAGDDGSDFTWGAQILGEADGTVSAGVVPGRLAFFVATTGGVLTERLRITAAGEVRPGADNVSTLGTSAVRWSVVYAATGTINTSDAREKQLLGYLTESEFEVSKQVSRMIGKYQWLQSLEEKGLDARIHVGPTAQAVYYAFQSAGLDASRYGLWCSDKLEDGRERQSLRADQLALFMIAGLEQRVSALEEKV